MTTNEFETYGFLNEKPNAAIIQYRYADCNVDALVPSDWISDNKIMSSKYIVAIFWVKLKTPVS